jgi:hypothetical protein
MAFPSKVKAGSMATRATMYPDGPATRRGTMSDYHGPVPTGDSGEAKRQTDLCQAGETPGARGAEGHAE